VIDLNAVQSLVYGWWCDYDQGNFDAWPSYFCADAHFECRSDSGDCPFEEFIRTDLHGRDAVLAWQVEHRNGSPYPLRHYGTNIHITGPAGDGEGVSFRSYLLTTQVVDHMASNLASGVVLGTVREEDGRPRFAELRVILDTVASVPFAEATRFAFH
jgi:SnoaL-like protein